MKQSPDSLTFSTYELKLLEKYLHYCLLFSMIKPAERIQVIDLWQKIVEFIED